MPIRLILTKKIHLKHYLPLLRDLDDIRLQLVFVDSLEDYDETKTTEYLLINSFAVIKKLK